MSTETNAALSTAMNAAVSSRERRERRERQKLMVSGKYHLIDDFKSTLISRKNDVKDKTNKILHEMLASDLAAGKSIMVRVISATDFANQDTERYEEWQPWRGSFEQLPESGAPITYYGENRVVMYALLMHKSSDIEEYASVKDSASVFVDVLID